MRKSFLWGLFLLVFAWGEVWGGSFYLSLLKKRREEGFKVKYRITTVSREGKETLYMVLYRKGNRYRMDVIEEGQESRVYTVEGKNYTCSRSEEGWQCFEGGFGAPYMGTFQELPESEEGVSKLGSRLVAGKRARCYRPKVQPAPGEEIEFCVSKEGLPLYVSQKSPGNAFTMEAVEYSLKVSDSDFLLPARPFSLKDMMRGLGGMGLPYGQ